MALIGICSGGCCSRRRSGEIVFVVARKAIAVPHVFRGAIVVPVALTASVTVLIVFTPELSAIITVIAIRRRDCCADDNRSDHSGSNCGARIASVISPAELELGAATAINPDTAIVKTPAIT